jgi:hypothetical protein
VLNAFETGKRVRGDATSHAVLLRDACQKIQPHLFPAPRHVLLRRVLVADGFLSHGRRFALLAVAKEVLAAAVIGVVRLGSVTVSALDPGLHKIRLGRPLALRIAKWGRKGVPPTGIH